MDRPIPSAPAANLRSAADQRPSRRGRERPTPPRLLDRVCTEILARRYSLRTQDTYVDWIRRPFATHLLQAGYDTRTVQELFDCSGIQA